MDKNTLLIVGASSAIGCELIRRVAGKDALILAHYNSGKSKLDLLDTEAGSQVVPIQADLSTSEGADAIIASVKSHCEFPNRIVFFAAPPLVLKRFKDVQWDDFASQLNLQLRTSYAVLKAFLPLMSAAKSGKVVFVLSSYTLGIPPSAMSHYVTAKYALLGFMKSLSAEYAGKGICVNAVSPSMVETAFLSGVPRKLVEIAAQEHPMNRNGRPADVAPVIEFLLSDDAGFMTGVNVPVTGGAPC